VYKRHAWLCVYHDTRFAELCERIVRLVDVNPRRLVGVIAPNNAVRDKYYRQLKQAAPRKLDHGLPAISTFYGNHRPNVRFDEGGILVINAQACKGLEFDVAVLADVDQHRHDPTDEERSKKLFYVMVARAREQVILLRKDGQASRIDDILPDDPEILKRRDIARRPR